MLWSRDSSSIDLAWYGTKPATCQHKHKGRSNQVDRQGFFPVSRMLMPDKGNRFFSTIPVMLFFC